MRSRICSIDSLAKSPSFQVPVQPQTAVRKLCSMWLPSGVCVTSGWNCTPKTGSDLCLHRGDGAGGGLGQRHEIVRDAADLVAVAHPDVELLGHAGE